MFTIILGKQVCRLCGETAMVAIHLPLHLCSIISIEAVSYSKWTVLTWHFLAPEAGAYVIKRIQSQCPAAAS